MRHRRDRRERRCQKDQRLKEALIWAAEVEVIKILTDGNENENLSEVVEETVIDALITISQGQGEIDMDDH